MKRVFAEKAWEDYLQWPAQDTKILERPNTLIRKCRRTPFSGAGKPEPLRGDPYGWWSRRITLEHRLVYRVAGWYLLIRQYSYHY
jgi:toxin YoeB